MKRLGIPLALILLISAVASCTTPVADESVQYDLTVSSTAGGEVTTPGEGVFAYDEGTTIELVAGAEEGYQFVNWTDDVDTIADVDAASTTITMNGDYSVTASFEEMAPAEYTLTISSTSGGSVTTPGEEMFTYDAGTVVDLGAQSEEGYRFDRWTGDVATVFNINMASTTIRIYGDYSITANFETDPIPSRFNAGYEFFTIPNNIQDSIMVAMWYPTLDEEAEYSYNTASTGVVVKGRVSYAASEVAGNHPAIIFSHGFSGGGIGSVEIVEALARAGYYVFAPDHNDAVKSVRIQGTSSGTLNDALDYLTDNPFGNGEDYLYRVTELQSTIDFVTSSSFRIDKTRITLGGHSMGGWTVMKVMADGFNPTAMFLFSMGELNWLYNQSRYFEASTFQSIEFPTAYFYGGAEYGQAIAAGLGNVYAAYCFTYSPSPSYGLLVKQGNHFTYNSEAVAPGSYGSAEQLESINSRLTSFLDRHVRGHSIVVTNEPEDVSK